jgi:hypothetical protein
VDFSEARDLFVNIFQILGPNCKIMDCGLISEKVRGLSAKSAKDVDRELISKKHEASLQNGGEFWLGIYFSTSKVVDQVHVW